MDSADDIDSLPIDENEKFVASEFSALQRAVKKKAGAVEEETLKTHTVETRLVRDLKIVMISTVLFLLVGHPKVDETIQRLKLDTLTNYTIKASAFAILLFIFINRAC